jgi:type I restriction enzyme S subunit
MKIKDICTYAPKSTIKAGDATIDGQYMFFTSSEDVSKRYGEYQFDCEGIIMGTGGNATLHYYNGRFAVSTDCVVLLPDDRLRCKYLYYFFLANRSLLEAGFKGAGLKHTNKGYIGNIDIQIPPLEEQDSIVNALDRVFEIKRSRNKELALLDNLIKARFVEMFGEPIENTKKLPTEALKDVLVLEAGDFTAASDITDKQTDTNKYPCYGGNGVRGYVADYNQEGDYSLIGRQGALSGNVQFVTGRFKNTEHALLVTPLVEMDSIWLNQLLANLDLKRYQTGAAQPGLSVKNLQEIQIIIVPIDGQDEYAEFVKQVDKSKAVVQKSLYETQVLCDCLMQEYFG